MFFTATAIACLSRRQALAGIGDFRSVTCSAATSVLSNFALYSRSARRRWL
jgi:hypothetical protein